MKEETVRVCRQCLTRDMAEKDQFENLYRLIALIPEEEKVDAETYEKRLAACRACRYLLEGICHACGCFAELRAARADRDCPYEKWQKIVRQGPSQPPVDKKYSLLGGGQPAGPVS
ncbi:MAG: DUF6171 family protein [Eubacteriales bacterium]|nr:DUF6171 family protein [Eubacteriales bacterium]